MTRNASALDHQGAAEMPARFAKSGNLALSGLGSSTDGETKTGDRRSPDVSYFRILGRLSGGIAGAGVLAGFGTVLAAGPSSR